MKINKLKIKDDSFDVNLTFYNFLKKITQSGLTDNQINNLLSVYYSNGNVSNDILKELFYANIEENITRKNLEPIYDLFVDINEFNLPIFIFSLKLNLIKDLLLNEAKITRSSKLDKLKGLNQLSLAYDKVSTQVAYATRISGALLSLLFFDKLKKSNNFILNSTNEFIDNLITEYKEIIKLGVEPNQIFMLLLSESINQSIISTAGVSYEDRIRNILIAIGIPTESITKTHDVKDSSTEFDFFFTLNDRTYGIGAKRTLRERYKQFIKTSRMTRLDVMIEITLGTDLRENIAKSIRKHGVYLFVADEVYESKKYLQEIDGIYPASQLNSNLLEKLN
jgi:hypothetical protein